MSETTQKQDSLCRAVALGESYGSAYTRIYDARSKHPRKLAWRELNKPHVAALLDRYREKLSKKLDLRDERIMEELARVGLSTMHDFVDMDTGTLLPVQEMPTHAAAAVAELTQTVIRVEGESQVVEMKLKLHPKLPALVKLAELKGLNPPPKAKRRTRMRLAQAKAGGEVTKTMEVETTEYKPLAE